MKMSPWRSQGVLQADVAVIERNAPIQSLVDVDFGSRKAEALPLLRDLEAQALPLHDVVVADHAGVDEAADAFQIFRRRAPCGLHFARAAGEAAVVIGNEEAQHSVGGVQIASLSQPEFAGKAILEHAPEAFDDSERMGIRRRHNQDRKPLLLWFNETGTDTPRRHARAASARTISNHKLTHYIVICKYTNQVSDLSQLKAELD
jgi:hypothetical protein